VHNLLSFKTNVNKYIFLIFAGKGSHESLTTIIIVVVPVVAFVVIAFIFHLFYSAEAKRKKPIKYQKRIEEEKE
jgi:flagellar basal body-associated protein FliL